MATTQATFQELKQAGLDTVDPEIARLIGDELERQRGQIELIASENFTWPSILEAISSVPTNKYAEGYPGKRYYGGCEVIARTLLPGGFTLILPNPACRFRWLTGLRTDAIGVRVPELPELARRVVEPAGCVVATSANDPGGRDPVTLDDVPARIRDGCAAEVDIGPLPGTPSTVIDFTGPEPFVIREGAEPSAEALARVREALTA